MNRMTLQTKLIGCLFLTSTVLIGLSLYLLFDAWQANRRAEDVIQMSRQANFLFMTFKDLTFERGRTNVVLSSEKPIASPDRDFIETRRKSVDENMSRGLAWLVKADPPLAVMLRKDYDDLVQLRREIDAVWEGTGSVNRSRLRDAWYEQTTRFIHHIIEVLDIVGKRQKMPGHFANYHRLLVETLVFRDRIGQSGSIITAALSKNVPLQAMQYRLFMNNLAQADYVWSKMEAESVLLGDEKLNRQKDIVSRAYYGHYRPALEETVPLALAGNASPERIKQLKALSVPAFDSVFLLLDQYKNAIAAEMYEQKSKAFTSLMIALIQFIVGLTVVVLTILYFRNKLFRPLNRLIGALEVIKQGEAAVELSEETRRTDEIGQLATGVKRLEVSMAEERKLRKLTESWAITDELTGLQNRHFLSQNIEGVMDRSDRYGEPLSMVMFDLDHFKQVNDVWGHPAGDAVLKETARLAEQLIRSSDWLVRFGGEEFILVMPQTTLDGAFAAAEKIREALERSDHPDVGKVTASFGASQRKSNESFDSWYGRTDQALYQAKQSGRNRVVSAVQDALPAQPLRVEWVAQWEVGHPLIDEQHRKLVEISNNLIAMLMAPQVQQEEVRLWLSRLLESLEKHFKSEEQILADAGYPELSDHAALHDQLLRQTQQLKASYLKNEIGESAFILFVVQDVVMGHMLKEDKLFIPYIKKSDESS